MKQVLFKNEKYSIDEYGQRQGRSTSYHTNGNIYIDCFYRDNKRHGEYKCFWANGRTGVHCFYVDDVKVSFNKLKDMSDAELALFMLDNNLPLLDK